MEITLRERSVRALVVLIAMPLAGCVGIPPTKVTAGFASMNAEQPVGARTTQAAVQRAPWSTPPDRSALS